MNRNDFDGSLLMPDGSFEKKTGREDYCAMLDEEHFFYDTKSNTIPSEFTASRNCPLCGFSEKKLVFEKKGFWHVRCVECGFLYVDPILNKDAMERHYREENAWTRVMLNATERDVNTKMYQYTLQWIKEKLPDLNTILDVGAGTGLFLEVAASNGYDATGIELNEEMLQRAESSGINMKNTTLGELEAGSSVFDLVTSWFVLEHVPDPAEFVRGMSKVIRKEGLLFVGVPNIDALATRILFKSSATFAGHSHINFFNKNTLNRLVSQQGFELIHAETYITQLNNIRKGLARLGLTEDSGLNRLMDLLTPDFIHDNFLGNFLCCLFRKS